MKAHPFWRAVLALTVLLVASIGLLLTFGRSWVENRVAEPAKIASPPASMAELSPDEQAFYDAVVPRMLVVSAEAAVLAELGKAHSRNLLEIQTRGNRVTENSAQIEAYATEHGVPPRFAGAYGQFLRGVNSLQRAMNDSRQGMLSLDWDKVAAAISVFEAGAADVASATQQMQQSATSGTPEP